MEFRFEPMDFEDEHMSLLEEAGYPVEYEDDEDEEEE